MKADTRQLDYAQLIVRRNRTDPADKRDRILGLRHSQTAQMTGTPLQTAAPRLPIIGTILRGYREGAALLSACLGLAVVWTITLVGSELLTNLAGAASAARAHYTYLTAGRYEAIDLALHCLWLLALVPIGVTVYRAIIMAEKRHGRSIWQVGRREMRLFGLAIVLGLPLYSVRKLFIVALNFNLLPSVVRQTYLAIGSHFLRLASIDLILHLVYSLVVTPFFAFAFALAAIDAPPGVLRRSARLTRGCRLPVATIGFVAPLPLWPIVYLSYFLDSTGTNNAVTLESAIASFLGLLASILTVAVYAVAFQRVTAHRHKDTYEVFD